jgi:predicted alpha/beta hydrolase family esterase
MKKQVLIVHGGNTFTNYSEYIESLKTKKVELEKLKYRLDWKDTITDDLGDKFEVLVPRMPNGTNAKYNEWKIWFEQIIPLLKNDVILIGHSLGGIFLAKYLSQNLLAKKVKAVILISAPYKELDSEEIGDFSLPKSLSKLNKQIKTIILIQSEDDIVVPASHVYLYKKQFPEANLIMFKSNGHFKQPHFPELVKLIKGI